ncbi:MAG TPA: helix-turn-helix domain-containing protein [Acetobacteraceae bacterium]|nr:helix-turn-helix domain-containing protein [Acetobacteraceae bacterium]
MPNSSVLNFADPYDYQRAVHAANLQVTVATGGTFEAELTRIKLDRLWMQRARLSLPAITHSAVSRERSMIFLQFDPEQPPILHSGHEVPPGDIVCYSPGSEHHYRTSTSYHCGGMSLAPEDLATMSETLAGRALAAPSVTRVIRPRPELMARLQSLHKAAGDLAAAAPDVIEHPQVARAIEQELVRAMVACLTDEDTEERSRSSRTRTAVMQRFEQMLEMHSGEPLYVTDICAGIGVSERTLRLRCQDQLGVSPHRYLWLRRMNLARRALAVADAGTITVTQVANDLGFGELGRFAVSYRKLFGESPSATLRRTP